MNRLVTPSVITAQLAGSWTFLTLPACFHETGFTMNRLSRHGKTVPPQVFQQQSFIDGGQAAFSQNYFNERERASYKNSSGKKPLDRFLPPGRRAAQQKLASADCRQGVSVDGRRSTPDWRVRGAFPVHDGARQNVGVEQPCPLSPLALRTTPLRARGP